MLEHGGVEIHQQVVRARNGDAEGGFIEDVAVVLPEDIRGEIEFETDLVEVSLFLKPVAMASGEPAGEVIVVEGVTVFGKPLYNRRVRNPVTEHQVNELAEFERQARDFSVAAAFRS